VNEQDDGSDKVHLLNWISNRTLSRQRKLTFDTEEPLDLGYGNMEGRAWRASSQLPVNLNVNEQAHSSDSDDFQANGVRGRCSRTVLHVLRSVALSGQA